MKFLAKVKKIFNLNKLGNCFHNRSGKSDPRKATPHSESETRHAMPITCLDLPKDSINLPVNPIREKLERDFELGIKMNECIKLLSLSDTELIDRQETLMANYDLFKYQLDNEQKIIILYILRNFQQEIKDQICETADLAIDKYLSEIDYDFYLEDNEWHNSGS